MAEELVLTAPIVQSKTTTKYQVVSVMLDMITIAAVGDSPGLVAIVLRSDIGDMLHHTYTGAIAQTMIRTLNTANLTTKSLHKRILERLSADGIIPGTVTGTPDPAA